MKTAFGWAFAVLLGLGFVAFVQAVRGERCSEAIGGYVGKPADFMPTDEEWAQHTALYDDEGGER